MNHHQRSPIRITPTLWGDKAAWLPAVLILLMAWPAAAAPQEKAPTPADLLSQVGIPAEGRQRGQMDIVGFASNAVQMDAVLAQCRRLAAAREEQLQQRYGWTDDMRFVAGVCPHDD
ncbi:MAG: hypothetical protein JXQ27_08730, partial [Acidobacteria bacterium]|nr:hypothetical protein [Acidobacteriota bacterium]